MANYEKINWENYPSMNTPLDADNLNHMEDGISTVASELEQVKSTVSTNKSSTDTAVRDQLEFKADNITTKENLPSSAILGFGVYGFAVNSGTHKLVLNTNTSYYHWYVDCTTLKRIVAGFYVHSSVESVSHVVFTDDNLSVISESGPYPAGLQQDVTLVVPTTATRCYVQSSMSNPVNAEGGPNQMATLVVVPLADEVLDGHTGYDGTVYNSIGDSIRTQIGDLNEHFDYVTPEMYGAKGGGVTDDTQAWQSAVDSGKKVIATKGIYKCGKITVSADVEIDCANASFNCTENILFDCSGSVADSVSGSDYSAWQTDYNVGDSHTGLAMLKGTNNAFHARAYYYGGFVCECVEGVVKNSYPIDVTNVTIEKINPITVNIKNIKNVVFEEPDVNKVVRLTYNKNSIIENISQHGECFSIVSFESSYGCTAQNCEIRQTTQPQIVGYAYPIEFIDSSYCIVSNCKITNLYWHSITTGGNYLCYGNVIEDCILHSSNAIPAYHDHENGIGSKLIRCEISTATVGALSEVEGCTMLSCGGTYKESAVRLLATDNAEIAKYKLANIKIIGADDGNNGYFGVCIYSAPQVSDEYEYHVSNVIIDNVICMHDTLTARLHKRGDGTVTFDTVDMNETNLTVMVNVGNVFLRNLKAVRGTTYPAVGGTGYTINNIVAENSFVGNFVGTIGNIRLTNCISMSSMTNANAVIYAMACALTVAKAVMKGGKLYAKNCVLNNASEPVDVIGISGVGYYGSYTANGYTVTQIS